MSHKPSKRRLAHELFTDQQRSMMRWLVDNGYGIETVMERYGLTELAAQEYIDRAPRRHTSTWCVRWYDSAGEKHVRMCNDFRAAKEFHAALGVVEWSKIERC